MTDPGEEYAEAYLKRAAEEPAGGGEYGDFELEVQDRRRQPPTDSQMKSILQYLKITPAPPPLPSSMAQSQDDAPVADPEASSEDGPSLGKPKLDAKGAAMMRKVKEMQLKMREAQEQAQREKQQVVMDAGAKVDSLPRPPLSGTSTAADSARRDEPILQQAPQQQSNAQSQVSSLLDHLTPSSSPAGAPSLREGPILVWWDEGKATTSLQGVQAMLEAMKQQNASEGGKGSTSGGCVVA